MIEFYDYQEKPECFKCGSTAITTEFHDSEHAETVKHGECLLRECGICGFRWAESCKDAN